MRPVIIDHETVLTTLPWIAPLPKSAVSFPIFKQLNTNIFISPKVAAHENTTK